MAKGAYIGIDGKARKIKKGYVGVESFIPRALPSGYTQVEYIEGTGTQYIDTGWSFGTTNYADARVVSTSLFGYAAELTLTGVAAYTSMYYGCDGSRNIWYGDGKGDINTGIKYTEHKTVFDMDFKNKSFTATDMEADKVIVNTGIALQMPTHEAVSFCLFAYRNSGTNAVFPHAERLYGCEIYENGVLVRDFVPCRNSAGTAGLYDLAGNRFYGNAGTGAFAAGNTYPGVARKIKKAYIGIGGVARPCWSEEGVKYYGTVTALSTGRSGLAATTVGNYGLFGGGSFTTSAGLTYLTVVDAYNASLTRSTPSALSEGRTGSAATTVGNYGLFAGGMNVTGFSYVVNAYNTSLTRSTLTSLSTGRSSLAATTVGNYGLFGGGTIGGGTNSAVVNAYDTSLTRSTPSALSAARSSLAATTVGNYGLFGGGTYSAIVNAYNTSLTRSTLTSLSTGRSGLAATTVGNYGLFAGGHTINSTYSVVVDAYNGSLTRSTPSALSTGRYGLAATTVGNYGLFGGGGFSYSAVVDAYDTSLTRYTPTPLSAKRYDLAATTVGNYGLFGGGSELSVVDAYISNN